MTAGAAGSVRSGGSAPAQARFECAVASLDRGEPLFATASTVSRWLMIEVPGAWGPNSVVDTALAAHVDAAWVAGLRKRSVRILAVRRTVGARPDGNSPLTIRYVEVGRPGSGSDSGSRSGSGSGPGSASGARPGGTWDRTVPGLDAVADATRNLGAGAPGPEWTATQERTVLVCTNGRHDQCCAVQGRPVAKALRSSPWSSSVWESSHVGGDRFAANIVVLPDGLYFGRCTEQSVVELLDGMAAGHLDPGRFRGRSSRSWPEQAAEHFVRTRLDDWALDTVGASRVLTVDGQQSTVRLEVRDRETVTVKVSGRLVTAPSRLACKGPEGDKVLTWELVDLTGC